MLRRRDRARGRLVAATLPRRGTTTCDDKQSLLPNSASLILLGTVRYQHLVQLHTEYMQSLKWLIKLGGIASTLGLFALCHRHRHRHRLGHGAAPDRGAAAPPLRWWVALFAPGPWLLAVRETGLLAALPAPYGLLLAGGSFNICFFVFFLAAFLSSAKVGAFSTSSWRQLVHHTPIARLCGVVAGFCQAWPCEPRAGCPLLAWCAAAPQHVTAPDGARVCSGNGQALKGLKHDREAPGAVPPGCTATSVGPSAPTEQGKDKAA